MIFPHHRAARSWLNEPTSPTTSEAQSYWRFWGRYPRRPTKGCPDSQGKGAKCYDEIPTNIYIHTYMYVYNMYNIFMYIHLFMWKKSVLIGVSSADEPRVRKVPFFWKRDQVPHLPKRSFRWGTLKNFDKGPVFKLQLWWFLVSSWGEVWPRKEKARSNRCWFGSPVALVCSSDLGDLTLLERLDFHCPPQSLVLCPMCRNSLNQLPSGRRYVWIPSVMDHDHVETWTLKSCRMVMHVGGRTEWAESSEKWKSYGVVCFLATLLLDKPIFWIVLRCIVPRQNNRDRWSRTENLREYNLPHARQSTWETERRGASPKCASQHWKLIRIRIYNDISYYIMVFYVYCTVYLRLEIFQHHHFSWTFAQTQFQDRCVDGVQDIQKGKLDEVCPSWKSQNAFLALMRRWHPMAQRLWKPEGFNRLGIFWFIKDIELLS